MIVLALETATITGGAAILKDNALIGELRMNVEVTHSERLLPGVDRLLTQCGIKLEDVDLIAVSIGPGSFTGLRVGLSMAKGLSFAAGKPIVPVPTLEALAWNFPMCRYPVLTLFDARKKELYGAIFEWTGKGFSRLVPESVMNAGSWAEAVLEKVHGKAALTGEGALLYKSEFQETLGDKAVFAQGGALSPSPANVALLAEKIVAAGTLPEPQAITPFYIRKSEAELKFKIL
jgi:tRNA threonylcarbamoyladenosine biosynthesis protein TsaB